ncbi:MAG TPA: DUF4430 domain-containing protein [Verrucomicrobiae bacterium]|nr:DUF4430 domain-containing protein [Verrucomicrobiae bacterium]
MRNHKSKIIVTGATLVVGVVAVLGFTFLGKDKPKDNSQQTTQTTQDTQSTPAPQAPAAEVKEIKYDGVEGKNALELLRQSHKVETKVYQGMGELVTSIDGKPADFDHFWALYVNDQQSQVGADAYITKTADKLEWKFEEIKD